MLTCRLTQSEWKGFFVPSWQGARRPCRKCGDTSWMPPCSSWKSPPWMTMVTCARLWSVGLMRWSLLGPIFLKWITEFPILGLSVCLPVCLSNCCAPYYGVVQCYRLGELISKTVKMSMTLIFFLQWNKKLVCQSWLSMVFMLQHYVLMTIPPYWTITSHHH